VWLQCETAANCFQFAELLDCQGLLTDRNRKSRVPRPVSFVPRCGRYRQAVAGGCEPERRSCTLANWDRRDTTQCFGPCPTLTGYLQAVTRCSEPDRRSRALANWNCRRMPRCRDSYYTMAVCTHQPTESAAEEPEPLRPAMPARFVRHGGDLPTSENSENALFQPRRDPLANYEGDGPVRCLLRRIECQQGGTTQPATKSDAALTRVLRVSTLCVCSLLA
jgi:hypothetical protein